MFVVMIDMGLVPFYVVTIIATRVNAALPEDSPEKWSSFFDLSTTAKIVLATWQICIVVGAGHVVTAVISMYLAGFFLSNSRILRGPHSQGSKATFESAITHQYEKMDVSAPIGAEDTRPTHVAMPDKRQISVQVRALGCFNAHDTSRDDQLSHPALRIATETSDLATNYAGKRPYSFVSEPSSIYRAPSSSSSVYTTSSTNSAPPLPRKSSKRQSRFPAGTEGIFEASTISIVEESDEDSHMSTATGPRELRKTYQPIQQQYADEASWFAPIPLGMNPPTPPTHHEDDLSAVHGNAPLSMTNGNSSKEKYRGAPKAKSYGSLYGTRNELQGARPLLIPDHSFTARRLQGPERRGWSANDDQDVRDRVVSRTAVDDFGDEGNGLRGRNVSGKVAEEGRADFGWIRFSQPDL